jgi:GNAT superfamily N-acetyltransferase
MMLIRASEADMPEAVRLINVSYRGETARQGWTHESDYIGGERITLDSLRADLATDPMARLYLLRDAPGSPLLGCVWLEPKADQVWYLGLLTVRPDAQARQLGRRILSEAEALARAGGAARIRMTVVHLRDTLIAWYQRRGYDLTGDILPFLYGDPPRDDLHFVVLEKRL